MLALYGSFILIAGQLAIWLLPHSQGELLQWGACIVMAWPLLRDAFVGLKRGKIAFPALVALAFLACLSQGELLTAGLVAFFMLMADQLEHRSAIGARLAVEQLIDRTPDLVHLNLDGKIVDTPVSEIEVGHRIDVRPGEVLSIDGEVIHGESSCDESSISGESLPIFKSEGAPIYAGTTNLSGAITVQVTRIGKDTTVGKVQALILSASKAKTKFSSFVEANAPWYTQFTVMLAGITWFIFREQNDAISRAIAILIVGCPCSMVLATPSAMIAAITAAARNGVMVKRPQELENLHRIDHLFFDKTGTLTQGEMELTKIDLFHSTDKAKLLTEAASLAHHSNHPHARGLQSAGSRAKVPLLNVDKLTETHGQGLSAEIDGEQYWLGREEWVLEQLALDSTDHQQRLVLARKGHGLLGAFTFDDKLRPEAKHSIESLRKVGIKCMSLVTGDRLEEAKKVTQHLHFEHTHARCLPEDKLKRLEEAKKSGQRVAAIGDGINDAPLLAASQVGIAMGAMGSPVAIESSSVALMSSDLSKLPFLFELSKDTDNRIRLNIAISILVILLGLLFSSLGWVGPIAGAILHNLSAIFILFNSAQLLKRSTPKAPST
jgi:Cd2+/Zn2+-exporting ATPase